MCQEIIAQVKTGDLEAYAKLYQRFAPGIYRYLYWRVNSVQEAEDLVQEVFIRAWKKIKSFKKGSFKAWLYAIGRNLWIDYLRKQKKQIALKEEFAGENEEEEIIQKIDQERQIKSIRKHLQSLKKKYQEVIILRFLQDKSVKETAVILGKKENWVKVNTHRAIKKLKDKLNQQ